MEQYVSVTVEIFLWSKISNQYHFSSTQISYSIGKILDFRCDSNAMNIERFCSFFLAKFLSNSTKQLLFALCYAIFEVLANFFSPSVWRFAFECLKWDWWRINFTNLPFIFLSFVYWEQHHDGLSLSLSSE